MAKQEKPKLTPVQDSLASYVLSRIQIMKTGRTKYEQDWETYDELYEAIQTWSIDGMSNIKSSIYFSVIQSKVAEEINALSPIEFYPRSKEDAKKIPLFRKTWDYTWEKSHSQEELYKILLGKYIYGTAIWREEYVEDVRLVRNLKWELDENGHQTYGDKLFVDYKGVKGKYVPIYNFYKDPYAKWFHDMADCAELHRMNIDDVKRIYATSKNIDLVKPSDVEWQKTVATQLEWKAEMTDVEVFEYWNHIRDLYVVITADGIILEEWANPFEHKRLPYARMVNYMRDDNFYGKSEVEVLMPMVSAKETMLNQAIDMTTLNINKPMIVSAMADMSDTDSIVSPWKRIDIDWDVNQIRPLDFGGVGQDFYNMNNIIDDEIIRTSAIDTKALLDNSGETATKTAIKKESSLKRINLGKKVNDEIFWRNIVEMRVSNMRQFFWVPVVAQIMWSNDSMTIRTNGEKLMRRKSWEIILDKKDGIHFFDVMQNDLDIYLDVAILSSAPLALSQELEKSDRLAIWNTFWASWLIDTESFLRDTSRLFGIDPDKLMWSKQSSENPEDIAKSLGIENPANMDDSLSQWPITVQWQQPQQILAQ